MSTIYNLTASEPVNQQIYRILRKSIVSCAILPGTPLSEKEISNQFKVSRQPVREAFIKLAEGGLVQILPQRGTFVTKISVKRVIAGQFIREAVECAIIRRAATMITQRYLALLEENLRQQRVTLASEDDEDFLLLDDSFHRLIIDSIDCSMAWETIENIKANMDRVRFLSLSGITPKSSLLEQHENIFKALQKKDPEQAALAVKEHVSAILYTVTPISQQNTEWFEP